MKTLVIPDIHNKWNKVDVFLKSQEYDQAIFLGDYWDDFGETIEDTQKTAIWLKKSLKDPRHIHLIGNHDLPYIGNINNTFTWNIATSIPKNIAIHSVMNSVDFDRLLWYYHMPGFLFSHAGIHSWLIPPIQTTVLDWLKQQVKEAKISLKSMQGHKLYGIGQRRGGKNKIGGILCAHFYDELEFSAPFEFTQVVGHTPDNDVRYLKFSNAYCLDTQLNHYGVIENETLRIENWK